MTKVVSIDNGVSGIASALGCLPEGIGSIARLFVMRNRELAEDITEIYLRRGGALSFSLSEKNLTVDKDGYISDKPYICTGEDIDETVNLLCERSVHSHKDEMDKGYISSEGTVRAGVATYSSYGGSVWGTDSVCIRIPREVRGCSVRLFEIIGPRSALVFSPPGVGKTTLLRDAAFTLSDIYGQRCTVCDTRMELMPKKRPLLASYIRGKDKAEAIECAIRTMSPQAVLCDELGGSEETEAVLSAQSRGVIFIATAHGRDITDLLKRPNIARLTGAGVFDKIVRLGREKGGFLFTVYGADGRLEYCD